MDDGLMENTAKAVLKPRFPGQAIKVAEIVLKRRDRNLKANAERQANIAKIKLQEKQAKKGKLNIIRAERLVKDNLMRVKDRQRLLFEERKHKKKWRKLAAGATVAVVRNGRKGGVKEVKLQMKNMNLAARHTLVFMPNTDETNMKLRQCAPFVFWGPPTFQTIFNLVHKKVWFRDPSAPESRVVLSNNTLIEKHLGDLGVLCTEDLVHTIHTCSKHFHSVTKRLLPVQIGDVKKSQGLVHEKQYTNGNLNEQINERIQELIGE